MRMVLFTAALLGLAGCTMDPGKRPDPVPVQGSVTSADGRPVPDVVLNVQPLDTRGFPAEVKVGADGKFKADMFPGRYTYYFTAQPGKAAALNTVPKDFRDPKQDRTIDVDGSADLQIALK